MGEMQEDDGCEKAARSGNELLQEHNSGGDVFW